MLNYNHVQINTPEDTTRYAVELLDKNSDTLELDSVWNTKKEAEKHGVMVSRFKERCVFITTITNNETITRIL